MKVFETIYLVLLVALVIGVPMAAASRPDGDSFSWLRALEQGGIVAGIVAVLFVCNLIAGRIYWRSKQNQRRDDHAAS